SAVASARMRSNMNMPMVKPTSPSTITMSRVRARPVSMGGAYSWMRSYNRSQTPWPSFRPRASKWVWRRHSGRGRLPRGPARLGDENVAHMFGVGVPVGGQVQQTARMKALVQQVHEERLDQPPLVVPILVPGVGEVHAHLVQRGGRDLLAQHLDGVMLVDT